MHLARSYASARVRLHDRDFVVFCMSLVFSFMLNILAQGCTEYFSSILVYFEYCSSGLYRLAQRVPPSGNLVDGLPLVVNNTGEEGICPAPHP